MKQNIIRLMLTLLLVMGLTLRQMPDGLRFGVERVLALGDLDDFWDNDDWDDFWDDLWDDYWNNYYGDDDDCDMCGIYNNDDDE